MNGPATHFTPVAEKTFSRGFRARPAPVVSVAVMAGIPALVRHTFGDKVLRQANRAAMLDIESIEGQDCFIPHATMTGFLDEVERRTGEANLGLLMAPHLSIDRYGLWGDYVLAAETLRDALARAISTLGYHSRGDRMEVSVEGGLARASYINAGRENPGYAHVANGTAGVLLNLLRTFLPVDWKPLLLELDIPRPRRAAAVFEDVFACPVAFDAAAISISFDARMMDRPAVRRPKAQLITFEDLARARFQPASLEDFRGVVRAQIWAQVLSGEVSIDSTARALGTSVRSLQRSLDRDGLEFREMVNSIRVERAKELLSGTRVSITEISTELGYSAPANFARAFRKATGLAPKDFRRNLEGVLQRRDGK
ncbi:AraC family transcriptional regulator [Rhodobacteraceae bacterium DSL-40]|uniref:AraC family transcriptional regulator n=1 Tax=Amaricoccus sp. B4 TaxID=3368557 RepID=UPI0013A69338